jgi:hypothetical protein
MSIFPTSPFTGGAEDAAVEDAVTVIVPVLRLTMVSSPLPPTMPFAITCGLVASEDALTVTEPLLLIWSLPLSPRMPMLAVTGLAGG